MKNDAIKLKIIIVKHRSCLVFFLLALIISVGIAYLYIEELSNKILPYISYVSNQDEEQFVHDFVAGMEIQQDFASYHDFDLITLSFSDHDTIQQGTLQLRIIDNETEEILIDREIDMGDIHYAVPVKISFEDVGGGKEKHNYSILLNSRQTGETAVGIYGYITEGQTALINGEKSDFALSIGIQGYTKAFKILPLLVLAISMLAIVAVIFGTFEFKLKEQEIFLLLAIPFVSCMLMMWPGNHVYDETRHYYTVYDYSNRLLGYGKSEDGTELLMRRCDTIDDAVQQGLATSRHEQAQSWAYYIEQMGNKNLNTEMVSVDISYAPVVQNGTWIEYLPEIIGLTIGRLLRCDYLGMGTLARLMNIACYMALCYFAICKTPTLKPLFVLLSALPMNLYQVSGISYDGMTFGVGIVVFAFVLKLWVKGLNRKEWFFFAVFAMVLGSCKGGVYLTLLLLLFFIPAKQFQSRKWMKVFGIILSGGVSMLYSFVPVMVRWFGIGIEDTTIVNGVSSVSNMLHLSFAYTYPFHFIKMVVKTLIENADMYLGQMLGYRTAWANTIIDWVVMLPFLILMFGATVKTSENDFTVEVRARVGIAILLGLEIVGMHAIFLTETPMNSHVIEGCQGRYFILFIPCVLLLFRNNGIVFKEKREYLYPLFSMAQLVYMYSFLELFMCA